MLKSAIIARLQADADASGPFDYDVVRVTQKDGDRVATLKAQRLSLERRLVRLREAFLAGVDTMEEYRQSKDETAAAILSLMENQKLVAEGAGAVPVAAALFHKLPIEGKKVVCLISGGNIDVNILNRVITRGLVMSGRKANLTIALEDKPGQLERVAAIVSRCGSNVVSVLHDGSDPNMPISSCFLKLVLETRDHAQIEQIRQELTKEGFQLVAERV